MQRSTWAKSWDLSSRRGRIGGMVTRSRRASAASVQLAEMFGYRPDALDLTGTAVEFDAVLRYETRAFGAEETWQGEGLAGKILAEISRRSEAKFKSARSRT